MHLNYVLYEAESSFQLENFFLISRYTVLTLLGTQNIYNNLK